MQPQLPIQYNRPFPGVNNRPYTRPFPEVTNRPYVRPFPQVNNRPYTRPFPEVNRPVVSNIINAMNEVYDKAMRISNHNMDAILDQAEKERIHLKRVSNICSLKSNNIGYVSMERLNDYIKNSPENPALAKVLSCLIDYIVVMPDYERLPGKNLRLRHWLTNLKNLSHGSFGKTYTADLTNKNRLLDQFVVKAIDVNNDNKINSFIQSADAQHEFFVAQRLLNKLREDIPNFAYVYGAFGCTPPLNPNSEQVITYCNKNNKYDIKYIIYEKIEGPTASSYIENCSDIEYINIILQLTLALYTANNYGIEEDVTYQYTHYDLHTNNVIIKNITEIEDGYIPYSIEDKWVFVKTRFVATIIDFGFSFVAQGSQTFGHYGAEDMGVFADKAFPVYDLFKFLIDSYNHVNNQVNDVIRTLLSFFIGTENIDNIISSWNHGRPFLPNVKPYSDLTLSQFYIFIRNNFINMFNDVVKVDINPDMVYNCGFNGRCPNEGEIVDDITRSNENFTDLDIFNFYDLVTERKTEEVTVRGRIITQRIPVVNNIDQLLKSYRLRVPTAMAELEIFIKYNIDIYDNNIGKFNNIIKLTDFSNNELANLNIRIVNNYLAYTSAVASIMEATDNLLLANNLRLFIETNFKVDLSYLTVDINFNNLYSAINNRLVYINDDINLLYDIMTINNNNVLYQLYESIKWFAYVFDLKT